MFQDITIFDGKRLIGAEQPAYIIAEAGVNHNGDIELAKRLIDVAIDAGADAVKFQTFNAEKLASPIAPKALYQLRSTNPNDSQMEMLSRLELSPEAHRDLQAYSIERGITFISTPFDRDAVDLLDELGVVLFKVSSGDVTNLPLLDYMARKGKPIILSTGMSNLAEVDEAVRCIRAAGCEQLVLLHCVSCYPADFGDVNLRAMQTMRIAFNLTVGYSDHTTGIDVAAAAVALGAAVIEKHFTIDRGLPGPDHSASLEPDELAQMVQSVRRIESALGNGIKVSVPNEADTAIAARKSLTAARDILAGTWLTEEMIAIRRPGNGIVPSMMKVLVGRMVRVDVPAGSLMRFEMFD